MHLLNPILALIFALYFGYGALGIISNILPLNVLDEILARKLAASDAVVTEEGSIYKESLKKPSNDTFEEKNDAHEAHSGVCLLVCDQSTVSSRSFAIDKHMTDVCYSTTGCKRGKAYDIVTTTARQSFVGKMAIIVQGANSQGYFAAIMDNIGATLLVVVIFGSSLVGRWFLPSPGGRYARRFQQTYQSRRGR
ncbi:Plasma membrane ATPase [Penicillium pulvis]|uniref:Plasma membrane ATPase n=1 Tax=Penicillium pulvis TaxID=1562058 RepID=UPI002549B12D|nr:Plasma membrane ATPase [Penicillium pulvis]KAJ5798955.1 Plasma membrane ATPase [Penicillium pulvis]